MLKKIFGLGLVLCSIGLTGCHHNVVVPAAAFVAGAAVVAA